MSCVSIFFVFPFSPPACLSLSHTHAISSFLSLGFSIQISFSGFFPCFFFVWWDPHHCIEKNLNAMLFLSHVRFVPLFLYFLPLISIIGSFKYLCLCCYYIVWAAFFIQFSRIVTNVKACRRQVASYSNTTKEKKNPYYISCIKCINIFIIFLEFFCPCFLVSLSRIKSI